MALLVLGSPRAVKIWGPQQSTIFLNSSAFRTGPFSQLGLMSDATIFTGRMRACTRNSAANRASSDEPRPSSVALDASNLCKLAAFVHGSAASGLGALGRKSPAKASSRTASEQDASATKHVGRVRSMNAFAAAASVTPRPTSTSARTQELHAGFVTASATTPSSMAQARRASCRATSDHCGSGAGLTLP